MKLKDAYSLEAAKDQPRQHIKKQRRCFANNGPSSQGYGFSSGHVWMWELDYKESWAQKNWCFWTVVLEKTLESPLDCKEIHPVHYKDQSWVFIGRTDVEVETPILWPLDVKSWLIGKDPDAGKDWGQEEKGTTEDKMVGWHHCLNGHGFGWTPGVGDGQGCLACSSSLCRKVLDMTEWLTCTESVACQTSLSERGFSMQEYWRVLANTGCHTLLEHYISCCPGHQIPWVTGAARTLATQAPHLGLSGANPSLLGQCQELNPSGQPTCRGGNKTTVEPQGECGWGIWPQTFPPAAQPAD